LFSLSRPLARYPPNGPHHCHCKSERRWTTTAVNLAASLARRAARVLLIDMDAQGNATMGSGIDKRDLMVSTCNVHGYDLIPANTDLTAVEVELVDAAGARARSVARTL